MKLYKYKDCEIYAGSKVIADHVYYNLIKGSRQDEEKFKKEIEKQNKKIEMATEQGKQNLKMERALDYIKKTYNQIVEGYVYVFICNEFYKIGKSKSPEKRVKYFTTGIPYDVKILQIIKTKNMNVLELLLHNFFKDKNVNNEWFKLSEEDLSTILSKNFDDYINNLIDYSYNFIGLTVEKISKL